MLSSKIFSLESFDGKKYANESKGKFGFNVINILTKTVFMASLHDESNFNCFRHESFHSSLFYHCVTAEKNRWNLRLRTPLRNLSSEFFTPTIGGDSSGLLESFCGWQFWFTKALGWRENFSFWGLFLDKFKRRNFLGKRLTIFINHYLFKNIFNSSAYHWCSLLDKLSENPPSLYTS